MTDQTRALAPEDAELFAEIDVCLERWGHAIEAGLALAHEVRDACAELEEWLC